MNIISILKILLYLASLCILYKLSESLYKELNKKYFIEGKGLTSQWAQINFYKQFLVLVLPRKYFRAGRLEEGYKMLVLDMFLVLGEVVIFLLLLIELGWIK